MDCEEVEGGDLLGVWLGWGGDLEGRGGVV